MKLISEMLRFEKALGIQDAAGGVESARISLSQFIRIAFKLRLEVGIATTLVATIRQHDAASGGNSKDLISNLPYYYKADTDTEFTKVEADAVAAKSVTALDTVAGHLVLGVDPSDLDATADFSWVSVVIAAPGAARDVAADYLCEANDQPAHSVTLP